MKNKNAIYLNTNISLLLRSFDIDKAYEKKRNISNFK